MSVSVFYRIFLLFGNQLGDVEETVFPYNVSKLVHVVKTQIGLLKLVVHFDYEHAEFLACLLCLNLCYVPVARKHDVECSGD